MIRCVVGRSYFAQFSFLRSYNKVRTKYHKDNVNHINMRVLGADSQSMGDRLVFQKARKPLVLVVKPCQSLVPLGAVNIARGDRIRDPMYYRYS